MSGETPLQRTGRGGAGNFRRPSTDPADNDTEKGIIKEIKDSASAIFKSSKEKDHNKVEYVHHGRGGGKALIVECCTRNGAASVSQALRVQDANIFPAGNLSTTSKLVQPVQSVLAPKTEVKPARGRGGAGNIETATAERASIDASGQGNVVHVPAEEAEKAGKAVAEPQAAHLGEGREVVHDGREV